MGQLVDWPEVLTEGKTLEECRAMLEDALREMIAAYRQQKKQRPVGRALLEQIPVLRGKTGSTSREKARSTLFDELPRAAKPQPE